VSRVLSYVSERDFRVTDRLLTWPPPRWFRLAMVWASRLGDGWLWLVAALLLVVVGSSSCSRTLAEMALAMVLATGALVVLKKKFKRRRPCDYARQPAPGVPPLALFADDRFSFPSGHALNAFAAGSVLALSFPPLAPALLLLALSVGASRVVLGLHFVSDVLAGAALGSLIGALAHSLRFL
jgi:undecaprenyl-diphosphatase